MSSRRVPSVAVVEAVRRLGGDVHELEHLGLGTSNEVWALRRPSVVLTAYGAHHDAAVLAKRFDVARHLAEVVPFVRLLEVVEAEKTVAVWDQLTLSTEASAGPEWWAAFGAALRLLAELLVDRVLKALSLPVLHDVQPLLREADRLVEESHLRHDTATCSSTCRSGCAARSRTARSRRRRAMRTGPTCSARWGRSLRSCCATWTYWASPHRSGTHPSFLTRADDRA